MIEEIIYTSAMKGLRQGSRGFCTVVSTAGMALNTAERLESMSGYRHAFPMQDPRAAQNPVNYAHVTMRIGGQNVHIISRVSDAGQDYSGRTNKLAHHILIDDVNRYIIGPARLMADKTVLSAEWDGQVRNIPPRNLKVVAIPATTTLKSWKSVTSDTGWAGWIAEQLVLDRTPVSIIFNPGTDTLGLVTEILDLLPAAQRWNITFSTYFTRLLAGTECQLRFVLDDTPEATSLRNDARAKVVDLTSRLPPATGGPLVALARSGEIKHDETMPSLVRKANAETRDPRIPAIPSLSPALDLSTESDTYGVRRPPDLSPALPSQPKAFPASPGLRSSPSRRRSYGWLWYGLYSLLLIAATAGVTVWLTKPPGNLNVAVEPRPKVDPLPEKHGGKKDRQTKTSKAESAKDESTVSANASITSSGSEMKQADRSVAAEKAKSAVADAATLDTTSIKTSVTETPLLEAATASVTDPFELLRNTNFQDPHGMILVELKSEGSTEPEPVLSIPLVLTQDSAVQLAYHGSFSNLILGREARDKGYDIRLSEHGKAADGGNWKAALYQDGMKVFDFGEYTLKGVNTDSKVPSATHLLKFVPGELLKSSNPGEIELAQLFTFCPLVVEVTSPTHQVYREIVHHRRGIVQKAIAIDGTWSPNMIAGPNPLANFELLKTSDVKSATWEMDLEVRADSDLGKPPVCVSRFKTREKVKVISRSQTDTKLFTPLLLDADPDFSFATKSADVDRDAGFVTHELDFQWKPQELTPRVAHEFTVKKSEFGILRLPWIPAADKPPSADTFKGRLDQAVINLNDPDWPAELAKLEPESVRYRMEAPSPDRFAKDKKQFADEVDETKKRLESLMTEKRKLKETHEKELRNTDKGKQVEISKLNEKITSWESDISELARRVTALDDLRKTFTPDVHDKQFEAYKRFHDASKKIRMGFEVAIELAEFKEGDVEHPATRFYLIETDFSEEQR